LNNFLLCKFKQGDSGPFGSVSCLIILQNMKMQAFKQNNNAKNKITYIVWKKGYKRISENSRIMLLVSFDTVQLVEKT